MTALCKRLCQPGQWDGKALPAPGGTCSGCRTAPGSHPSQGQSPGSQCPAACATPQLSAPVTPSHRSPAGSCTPHHDSASIQHAVPSCQMQHGAISISLSAWPLSMRSTLAVCSCSPLPSFSKRVLPQPPDACQSASSTHSDFGPCKLVCICFMVIWQCDGACSCKQE